MIKKTIIGRTLRQLDQGKLKFVSIRCVFYVPGPPLTPLR